MSQSPLEDAARRGWPAAGREGPTPCFAFGMLGARARAVPAEGVGAGVGWTGLVKVTSLASVYWLHTLVLLAVHPWAYVTTIHVPVLSVKWAENIPTA